jgi:hypothetical protein
MLARVTRPRSAIVIAICQLAGCGVEQVITGTAISPSDTGGAPRTWRPLTADTSMVFAGMGANTPSLMTDGTVLVQQQLTNQWWKLTPDEFGRYADGTWSKIAAGPGPKSTSGQFEDTLPYAPLYYGSATLPDGRFVVFGGEYLGDNTGGINALWTRRGAIYDPIANTWKELTPPMGWDRIGDASGIVLDDGKFILSSCCDNEMGMAILDPVALTWTRTGEDKSDIHDEESWAQLPDGTIMTVDSFNSVDPKFSEIYTPATGKWTGGGDTPSILADNPAAGGSSYEVGPEVMRPDGTLVAFGGTVHNAVYDTHTKTWAALPDTPMNLDLADAPAALMPNGDILLAASPGIFNPPTHFFELHDSTFTEVDAFAGEDSMTSYVHAMLVLPTGEIMMTNFTDTIWLYTPAPGFPDNAQPVILGAPELVGTGPIAQTAPIASLYPNRTYQVAVTRMNGVSQGAYYGDDVQTSTNFPIVKVTNTETGHAVYMRTHDHSDRSISPDERGITLFDVPDTMELGHAQLVVIANGIPSPPIEVNVK